MKRDAPTPSASSCASDLFKQSPHLIEVYLTLNDVGKVSMSGRPFMDSAESMRRNYMKTHEDLVAFYEKAKKITDLHCFPDEFIALQPLSDQFKKDFKLFYAACRHLRDDNEYLKLNGDEKALRSLRLLKVGLSLFMLSIFGDGLKESWTFAPSTVGEGNEGDTREESFAMSDCQFQRCERCDGHDYLIEITDAATQMSGFRDPRHPFAGVFDGVEFYDWSTFFEDLIAYIIYDCGIGLRFVRYWMKYLLIECGTTVYAYECQGDGADWFYQSDIDGGNQTLTDCATDNVYHEHSKNNPNFADLIRFEESQKSDFRQLGFKEFMRRFIY